MRPAATVRRDVGATVTVRDNGVVPSRRNVSVTVAGVALVLASSTKVLKKPCEPSANSQRVRGPSTAVPPCEPSSSRPRTSSARPPAASPLVEVTTVETPPTLSSPGSVDVERRLRRARHREVLRDRRAVLLEERHGDGAPACVGLAMSTSRSKNEPVAPSARE